MLSPFQKATRCQCCHENLKLLTEDLEHFFQRLVTGDETWVYHRDPESKMESMQWNHKTSPPLKSLGLKNLLAKSWQLFSGMRKEGLLLLEFMPQKTTITGQTYANTITALWGAIKEKWRGKLSVGVLLLHDDASLHMSAKSQAAIRQCGFQQLNHPHYSPDIAPSDYFLFLVMKKFLRSKRFSNDEEVKDAVTTWFEEQPKDYFFLQGDKVVATKVGEVYWVIRRLHWKIKNTFCGKLFLSYLGR